jgi:PEP-CTERM motif
MRILTGALAGALLLAVAPASARLQLSISANGSTFTCFDGELGCDQSGGANNLLTVDTSIGGAFVQITLAQSAFGKVNELELSSDNILNTTGAPITIKLLASDTSFDAPVSDIRESGSLTFNSAVGSGASTLKFWADPLNTQGANPANTPGTLLDTVTGTPITNPDSFSGSLLSPFVAGGPFSMTEGASLALIAGASVTGFNQSMQTGTIPEPSTWAMALGGFGLMAWLSYRRKRTPVALA